MLAEAHKEKLLRLFLQKQRSITQKQAWDRACEMGLPGRREESFQKISLKPLFSIDFQAPMEEEVDLSPYLRSKVHSLVFINGKYCSPLSDVKALESCVVLSMKEAMQNYGMFLQDRIQKNIQVSRSIFPLLTEALQEEGLFLYVRANVQIEKTIQVLHVYTAKNLYATPQVQVVVGKGSQVDMAFEQVFLQESEVATVGLVDFSLEQRARCQVVELTNRLHSNVFIQQVRASIKRDAFFKHISMTKGSPLFRQDIEVELLEENSAVDLRGGALLEGSNRAHTEIRIEHKALNTKSNQLYKSVLKNKSRSTFEGKIYVEPVADQTEAYQLNKTLILDEGAYAFSKPNLEIFASDVKATHGATISELNEEELFYLQSRGLSKQKAKEMLSRGFLTEIMHSISNVAIQEELHDF